VNEKVLQHNIITITIISTKLSLPQTNYFNILLHSDNGYTKDVTFPNTLQYKNMTNIRTKTVTEPLQPDCHNTVNSPTSRITEQVLVIFFFQAI